MTAGPLRRRAAVAVGAAAGFALLDLAGRGRLGPPPMGSIDALSSWAEARDPVTLAMALVRLAAQLGSGYLLVVAGVGLVGHGLRWTRAINLADALATPATRRLIAGGVGLGLATSSTVGGAAADAALGASMTALPAATATMFGLEDEQASTGSGRATMTPVAGGAAMTPLQGTAAMTPMHGTATMHVQPPGTAAMTPAPAITESTSPTTWTVTAGDSLWSIAHEVMTDHRGGPVTDADVDPFWRQLVAANRARLADPDLVLPGQVIEVPPVPAAPATS